MEASILRLQRAAQGELLPGGAADRRSRCSPAPAAAACKPAAGLHLPPLHAYRLVNQPAIFYQPVAVQVHDAAELGEWVHRMRGLRRRGQLPPAAEQQLEALGFSWELDVVTAKWYHNLHAARQYRVRRWARWLGWQGWPAGNSAFSASNRSHEPIQR